MLYTSRKVKLTIITKFLVFFLAIFLLLALFNYGFIYVTEFHQLKTDLHTLNTRIKNDIHYNHGQWDMSLYSADPQTPNPTGSSGFQTSLYIVSNTGLVMERNAFIHGLLDTSDYKKLLTYESPQTISTETNENWRVYAQPIIQNGESLGAILVSYYNPAPSNITVIDQNLQKELSEVASQLILEGKTVNTAKVDIRHLPYDISFEIVDTRNKVLLNNGRTPSYIDPSYFSEELSNKKSRQFVDQQTKVPYFVTHEIITDSADNPVGIIVAGKAISSERMLLRSYIVFASVASGVLLLLISLSLFFTFKQELRHLTDLHLHQHIYSPRSISFDKEKGLLHVDNQKIYLPQDTNQYWLCALLFVSPAKAKNEDEILRAFGEEVTPKNWRKVYDASLQINKKVRFKLISYQNNSYVITSEYQNLIA